ncbi:hypothetical protein CEXT_283971, partial [Caerostris extrusa]
EPKSCVRSLNNETNGTRGRGSLSGTISWHFNQITNKKRKVQQTKGTHPKQKDAGTSDPPHPLSLLDRFYICLFWGQKGLLACNCGLEKDSSKVFFFVGRFPGEISLKETFLLFKPRTHPVQLVPREAKSYTLRSLNNKTNGCSWQLEVYPELFLGISIRITNKKGKVRQTKGTHPNQKMRHLFSLPFPSSPALIEQIRSVTERPSGVPLWSGERFL